VVAKLAKPVRRTKEMLSANIDAPFIVDELHDGIDFHSKITRDELEAIAGTPRTPVPSCKCLHLGSRGSVLGRHAGSTALAILVSACTRCKSALKLGAGPYWEDVKQPLVEILARNNITSAENITVQLLGGGSRFPRVQSDLASLLEGLSLEKNLDADEGAAMGGGLLAANLSTTFRLRQFGMQDGIMHPITITIDPTEGVPDIHKVRAALAA
jgi:hypoxia up-regulated 1